MPRHRRGGLGGRRPRRSSTYELGIDEFILSGYPHLEEAYRVGEGLIPVLRERGLVGGREPVPA